MSTVYGSKISDTSPASASTAVGSTAYGWDRFEEWTVYATITGATGGAIDVYLQGSTDGVVWYDVAHFPQVAAAGAARTYAVSSRSVPASGAGVTVGRGSLATPGVALAADAYTRMPMFNMTRAVYVAGASTSAGATQTIEIVGFISP